MLVAGVWFLGPGDASPTIRDIKAFMRLWYRSYAGHLADTEAYDDEMVAAVYEMQRRLADQGKLPANKVNGLIGASTKVAMGYLKATTTDIRPVLFTVCGTGVPWWVGPDADTARAVEHLFKWQPIGYPASPFPMGKSIKAGKVELNRQIGLHRSQIDRNGFALAAYSQGAVVASEVWEQNLKGTALEGRLRKAVTWGNPSREKGRVWPDNSPEPIAPPHTSGVAHPSDRLKNTPPQWRDYAHAGDLYTTGSDDAVGQDKTAIWRIIRGEKFLIGADTLLEQFLEVAVQPLPGAISAFRAMWDAMTFFGKSTGPHVNYNILPAIDYLRS